MSSSRLRPAGEQDAEAIAALFRAAYGDARPYDAAEILQWLRNTELRPEWKVVLEHEGRVVGYGDVWVEEDEVALDLAAPGHEERLLDWAESQAEGRRVRVYFPAGHELERLCEARGYRYWRSSFTMGASLDEEPPEPRVPAGLELRSYRDDDEARVVAALNESFAGDPFFHEVTPSNFREFNLRGRGFEPQLWVLAWDGEELAGFSLAYAERSGEPGLGWIGTLGVRPRWRRRGLGEALLLESFRRLRDRGLTRVGLGVDAENVTGALRLYERVGMRRVRQGDNWVLEPEAATGRPAAGV